MGVQPPRLFGDETVAAREPAWPDEELERVAGELLGLNPDGSRVGDVIRATYDQLLDGQRTGRWDWRELRKTEKTHMGTLVEINLHREFEFQDGRLMDYRIAGVEVDCKFSQSARGWQIPLEAVGHLCLLLWADDELGLFSGGLIRISEDVLRTAGNRDLKRTLNDAGLRRVHRLWHERPLPENLLLHLDARTRSAILSTSGRRGGQRRIDGLFRHVQARLVSRATVLTVGQQDDPPKRVRDARLRLRTEGIVVLGHQGDHPRIARALGLPVPSKGQWVSARITPLEPGREVPSVLIRGTEYRLALPQDVRVPAPLLDAQHQEL
jgi:hypothetical protein